MPLGFRLRARLLGFTACLLGMALIAAISPLKAHALDFAQLDDGWTWHDLSGEGRLRMLLGGPDGSLTFKHSGDKSAAAGATVFVFRLPAPKDAKLAADAEAWSRIIIGKNVGKNKGTLVSNQKTFKIDGQWRYYAEIQSDSKGGNPIYSAVLALVKDGRLVVLDYHQVKEFFVNELPQVKALYHNIKVNKP
jgi:hypothetical protein